MRVLHVLDHSLPLETGYSLRTMAMLRHQRARGLETLHVTSPKQKSGGVNEEDIDGWRFYRVPVNNTLITGLSVLSETELIGDVTYRLEQLVKRMRPHILHAHSPVLNGLPALRVAHRVGTPLVYEVRALWEDVAVANGTIRPRGVRYRFTRALETYLLKRADAVLVASEGLRNDVLPRAGSPERVSVVPNAIDAQWFGADMLAHGDMRAALGLDSALVVGYIGSFDGYEGLMQLIEALADLRQRIPGVKLLLVGDGPQQAELRARAAALGLNGDVVFAGRVAHAQTPSYFAAMDVLAYPRIATRATEMTASVKPLEAMALGKIVVASDVGGNREMITHEQNGYLFRAGDRGALVEALTRALEQRDSAAAMQDNARRFAQQQSWDEAAAFHEQLYTRLSAARRRRS